MLVSNESEAVSPVIAKLKVFIVTSQPVMNERNQSRSQRNECERSESQRMVPTGTE